MVIRYARSVAGYLVLGTIALTGCSDEGAAADVGTDPGATENAAPAQAPQSDTPQGDTPQEDAPQSDTSQGDTPQGDTSQGDTPQADTPQADTSPDETPQDGTTEGDETAAACDTTWAAIQETVFRGYGCAESACHDSDQPEGMLDLSSSVAYQNLINVESSADINMPLVTPGEEKLSLLYLKLEAKVNGTDMPAGGGSAMPVAGSALSAEALAAVRLWIRGGARETGVVDGTQDLLACELPAEADPNKVVPPPVPAPNEGFQHYSGPWTVKPGSENEVCFGTYYDLTDSAPDWALVDCTIGEMAQTCVAFDRRQLTQDAQSHHSIIDIYAGDSGPSAADWGQWRCAGGDLEGTPCDPTQPQSSAMDGGGDCGERAICQTDVVDSITCAGFGPTDTDTARVSAGGAQTPVSTDAFPDGVYSYVPLKGVVIWNSHAFNLTQQDTTIEQYNNFWYAQREDQQYRMNQLFDTRNIFVMNVPPFESREYCATFELPQYARLSNLNSHAHKRGVLWRTWLPPNVACLAGLCQPRTEEPIYVSRVYNDPVYMDFEPPMEFNEEDPSTRTLLYCATYDNGEADPSTVKRATGLPEGASECVPTHCVGGSSEGTACTGDDECGGDGVCDACTLTGGFTTEDEMMILQGSYYVQPPEE